MTLHKWRHFGCNTDFSGDIDATVYDLLCAKYVDFMWSGIKFPRGGEDNTPIQ